MSKRLGPYLLGPNETVKNGIYTGDARELAQTIPNESVDLIFTSPPYFNAKGEQFKDYQRYLEFLVDVLQICHRVLNRDGILVFNTSPVIIPRQSRSDESIRLPIPFDSYHVAQKAGFKYIDDIIWKKPDEASSRAIKFAHHRRPVAYKPFTVTEYLFVFRRGDAPLIDEAIRKHSPQVIKASLVADGYEHTNVWQLNPVTNSWHSSAFPLGLAERIISYYSFVGDNVCNLFMGSGTTAVAAKKLGRLFLGFEIDSTIAELARERVRQARPPLPGLVLESQVSLGLPDEESPHVQL